MREAKALILVLALAAGCAVAAGSLGLPGRARAADGQAGSIQMGTSQSYNTDNQTATPKRASLGGFGFADPTSFAAVTSTTAYQFVLSTPSHGAIRQTLKISARFTASAATVSLKIVFANTLVSGALHDLDETAPFTLTAPSSGTDESGLYVAPTYLLDTFGAQFAYPVVTTAPSSGLVSIFMGSY